MFKGLIMYVCFEEATDKQVFPRSVFSVHTETKHPLDNSAQLFISLCWEMQIIIIQKHR